jgi:hypothetical protein
VRVDAEDRRAANSKEGHSVSEWRPQRFLSENY